MRTWPEILDSLRTKKEVLSFSSFSKFTSSPYEFKQYKLKQRQTSEAMIQGSLTDCNLFTPDKIKDDFVLMKLKPKEKGFPSTVMAMTFCWGVINGKDIEEAFTLAGYKKGSGAEKRKEYGLYIDIFMDKKSPYTEKMLLQAEFEKERLMGNSGIANQFKELTGVQQDVNWEYGGYKWRGVIDGYSEKFTADLKRTASAHPQKLRYAIRDRRMDWQGAMYNKNKPEREHFIWAVDKDGGTNQIKISQESIDKAWTSIDFYLQKFKECVFDDAFDNSYNYFNEGGCGVYTW